MEVQKLLGAKQMVMESLCGRPVACRSLHGSPKNKQHAASGQAELAAADGIRCLCLHMDLQLVRA